MELEDHSAGGTRWLISQRTKKSSSEPSLLELVLPMPSMVPEDLSDGGTRLLMHHSSEHNEDRNVKTDKD